MAQNFKISNEANRAALLECIAAARGETESEDYDGGLTAARRIYHDGIEWMIRFTDDPGFATVIYDADTDALAMSDDEVAADILSAWDADWDDIRKDNPVGDFSAGSSDFATRNDGWE